MHTFIDRKQHFSESRWLLKEPLVVVMDCLRRLGALSADTASQLDVLGHDGHPLGVDGTQVGVLKQTHQVSLAGLLQGHNGGALEAQVGLEVLGNLPDQALEGQLADEQLGRLLVAADLTQSHCAGPVTVGLLHSASGWRALAGGLGGELLPRGFATGGLASGLLGSGHVYCVSTASSKYCERVAQQQCIYSTAAELIGSFQNVPDPAHKLRVGHVLC